MTGLERCDAADGDGGNEQEGNADCCCDSEVES